MVTSGSTGSRRFIWVSPIGVLVAWLLVWPAGANAQRFGRLGGVGGGGYLRNNFNMGQGPSMGQGPATRIQNVLGYYPSDTGGVLSSSMYNSSVYTGGGYNAPGIVSGNRAAGVVSSASPGMQSRVIYQPDQPLQFSAGGVSMASGAYVGSLMGPLPEVPSTSDPDRPANIPAGRITSLVPKIPWDYKDRMVTGEKAFRNGDYAAALADFEKARRISDNCPETLLGLVHASLALAKDSYADPARYLAWTIAKFPYLPMVDVHPRDFFTKASDYDQIVARLEQAVKANPKDGSALLVLAYLKMRDNLFPVATGLLKEAAKVTSDRQESYAIDVLVKSMDKVRQDAATNAPKLAAPVEMAWAGLKLAVPEGFAFQAAGEPNQFLLATRGGAGTDKPQMITGFAYPVDKDVTEKTTLDRVAAMMSANVAVANLTPLDELEVPYLGTTALARLYGCEFMGQPVILVRLCFAREVAGEKLMYVLGMGLLEEDVESLLPTFAAVAKSVVLGAFQSPIDLLARADRDEIKVMEHGFALQQPRGWSGHRTARGYDMSATDLGRRGGVSVQAQAMSALAEGKTNAKAFGEKVIQDRVREGQRIDVVSESPVKFAGLDGQEFVIRRTIPSPPGVESATKPSPSAQPRPVLEIARLACTEQEGQTRVFALIVRGQDMDAQTLRTATDSLAAGFRPIKP